MTVESTESPRESPCPLPTVTEADILCGVNPHEDPRTLLEMAPEGGSPETGDLDLRVARHPTGPPPGLREAVMASSGAPMEVTESACPSLAADVLEITPSMVRVGGSVPQLLALLLSHRLPRDARVALAEPGPGGITQAVLDGTCASGLWEARLARKHYLCLL